jgi:hypothetical protein
MPDMSQTTQISPEMQQTAAQRVGTALLETLTRECAQRCAQEGFASDDITRVALSALVAVTAQFARHFQVDAHELVATLLEAMGAEVEETPNGCTAIFSDQGETLQ